jgi:hypothetical protein
MLQAADTIGSILQESSLKPKEEIALLSFVAGTLKYLLLPESRYRDLVFTVCTMAFNLSATSDVSAIYVISALIHSTKKREVLARAAIYDVMRQRLRGPTSAERAFVMFSIGKSFGRRFHYQQFHRREHRIRHWTAAGVNQNYFSELRQELRQLNYDRAVESDYEARLYIFAYADRQHSLFRHHGLAAFLGAGPYLVLNEMPNLLLLALRDFAQIENPHMIDSVMIDRSDRDDLWNLISDLSRLVESRNVTFPRAIQSDRSENDEIAEQVIRGIYFMLKKKRNVDRCARVLLCLGFALEDGEIADFDRGKRRKKYRLLRYMPKTPMDEVMDALKQHELYPMLKDWNEGEQL